MTLALHAVEETASYGVVPTADDGQVTAFLEKGEGPVPTNRINAGAYVVEREVVETMIPPGRAVSFEREVFPLLAGHGLYGYEADGYWVDIGQPQRYLEATWDLLAANIESNLPPRDQTGSLIYTLAARRGPRRTAERGGAPLLAGTDARIERAVLHDRVHVGRRRRGGGGGPGRAGPCGRARGSNPRPWSGQGL